MSIPNLKMENTTSSPCSQLPGKENAFYTHKSFVDSEIGTALCPHLSKQNRPLRCQLFSGLLHVPRNDHHRFAAANQHT